MSFKENRRFNSSRRGRCAASFAGHHYHSGGEWSGDYLVYDEDALRPATVWHYVHLHPIREIVLPAGREFKYPAKEAGVFKAMTDGKDC